MCRRPRCLLILALGSLLLLARLAGALEPPAFRGYVNDYALMLQPATVLEVEQTLRAFEEQDSTQVAVLTIDSLEGDDLEGFSIRTVERWQVGQQGKDNGILLLVVKGERKVRIEVGRGLEGVVTDLAAGRVIDHVIRPLFKAGRFDDGVRAGVGAIIDLCRGEFKAESPPKRQGRGGEPSSLLSYLLFGVFITSVLGRAARPLGVVAGALLLPLIAFFGLPSVNFLLLLLLMPVGALVGLLLPLLAGHMWLGGGGISLGGGGFGGGGGGFDGGGGGDFGGGGASGDW